MRHLRKLRISSKSWNNIFQSVIGLLISYFFLGKALSAGFKSLAFYLYLIILLLAFLYSFRRKKHWVLLGMGIGALLGLSLLINIRQTPLGEYKGIVIEAKKNYLIFLSKGRRYYVYLQDHDYYFGDLIKINGDVDEFGSTRYEGYFDFEKYLRDKGVRYQINPNQISSIFSIYPLRKVEKAFLSNFDKETASLIDAVLFSFKDSKDSVLSSVTSLGIYSQLSNGGLILYSYLRLFNPFFERHINNPKVISLIKVGLIIPFLILGPTKIGIWKLLLVNLSYAIFQKKEIRYEHRLAAIAIFIILLDRWAILSSGFFYGFGLSFLFILSKRMLNKGRKEFVKKFRRRCLLEAFLLPSSVSNGKIAILSPLLRLIITPLILPFIILSFVSFISAPFVNFLPWYAKIIRKILSFLSSAELSTPWIGNNSEAVVVMLYVVLVVCLLFIDCGLHYFAFKTLRLTGLTVVLNMIPIGNFFTQEVTFLNVGQGDAIIIRDRLKTVMIDTGGVSSFDMGKEVDIPYLYRRRIYHLDYLITTHDDFDHSGAVSSIVRNFDVVNYIDSSECFPLTIGNIHLENLNTYGGEGNDSSLVLYMEFIGKKFLFMGDASTSVEKRIIKDNPNLRADILKVGHHGSDTSSSESFIRTIRPKEAIISVGKKNYYGHPSINVLETLDLYDVKIRRTDQEGTITYWGSPLIKV